MIEKIKRWMKNKAGVSPIIAIILMVAITVVLAATIYIWVSGMGKTGGGAPSLSAVADEFYDKIIISQADKGLNWSKAIVSWSGNASAVTVKLYRVGDTTGTNITNGGPITATYDIQAGDYIKVTGTSPDIVTITITYADTNTNFGSWTLHL